MVSLPFSDHCEPLVDHPEDLEALLESIKLDRPRDRWKYIEIRPRTTLSVPPARMEPGLGFSFHTVDLTPGLDQLFSRLHKDSIQRKIRRAEREGLTYEEGSGETLVEAFYRLLLRTRRRQHLPPHPRVWFRNLLDCLGENAKIRIVSKAGQPIASILTLSFKAVLVYKYGCSDERFHNLGGMQLLFWNTLQDGKKNGAREFDLGRSDRDNPGLITFKDRWGASRSDLTYWRYPSQPSATRAAVWRLPLAKKIFTHIPDSLLAIAGRLLYRHLG
jgi:lipid II:glycine glycyltransferase (peptidoglycan interpeptide bridge formation enzyme)